MKKEFVPSICHTCVGPGPWALALGPWPACVKNACDELFFRLNNQFENSKKLKKTQNNSNKLKITQKSSIQKPIHKTPFAKPVSIFQMKASEEKGRRAPRRSLSWSPPKNTYFLALVFRMLTPQNKLV